MQFKTTGIILHSLKYSDSATIVTVFTKDFGRTSYMVYGANKKKALCRTAFLQPLSIVHLDVHHSPGKEVHHIKDIRIASVAKSIPFDPIKNALALFIAELLYRSLKETEANESLFAFLENSIEILDYSETGIANFHLVFLVKLSRYLGFEPYKENEEMEYFDLMNGVFVKSQPTHTQFMTTAVTADLAALMTCDYSTMNAVTFTRQQRQNFLNSMVEYYRLHIPNFAGLKSVEILKTLFD